MPKKLTQQQFIEKSIAKHGDKYSYENATYKNNASTVSITCKTHGSFNQRASNHMLGIGCPGCKTDNTVKRCSSNLDDFIKKAQAVHGDSFDYSKVDYTKSRHKVEIICPAHGSFWQTVNSHLSAKAGCPKCAGKFLSNDEFIQKLRNVHGEAYDYSNVVFSTIKEPISIICKKHGSFTQSAEAHSVGHGCRQCWYESYSSKAEKEVADWIESTGVKVERNNRSAMGDKFEIDIFLPEAMIGIEFNGRYWHSDRNKSTKFHEFKHEAASRNGIRIITVWDFEWETKPDIIKTIIKHAIGKSSLKRVNARDCTISEISSIDANLFYERNHIQGACRGSVANVALIHDNDIVAVMSFTQGGTRRGIVDGYELARYATSVIVRGGASKLFSAFISQNSPNKIWSFSDKQHFCGKLYETLNFKKDGEIGADYRVVSSSNNIVWHKSLWQRKSIPKRLKELGISETYLPETDSRTEKEMQKLANVFRVWDSGKIRWLWEPSCSTNP